jgi:ABC-2 type transport system ATP-binding protein
MTVTLPTTRTHAISAVGLTKSYGDKPVLDGIDLRVPQGSVFALLGPNGAGKTTAVQILSTLIPADGGDAYVNGHHLVREADQVRHAIGVTGQFAAVDNLLTPWENLLLMADLYHLDRNEGRARAADLLERFDLADVRDRPTQTFSGGMRRKLDVAMTLIGDPVVIFLDEPTTGLDPESRAAMWDEITTLATADRVTVLLTTHYLDEADRLAARLAVVDRGRVVAEGEPERLKRDLGADSLDAVYLHYAGRRYSDATRVAEVAGR